MWKTLCVRVPAAEPLCVSRAALPRRQPAALPAGGRGGGLWVQGCGHTPALLRERGLFPPVATGLEAFPAAAKRGRAHAGGGHEGAGAASAWDRRYCYVYANSLWHNSFETVENWIVPLGQTFRPPPWLYSSATVNWVQRWLHTLYFRERLQLGNNFCTGKTNANSWQKHWSCLVVQPPIWRNTDCAENFFGHLRSK